MKGRSFWRGVVSVMAVVGFLTCATVTYALIVNPYNLAGLGRVFTLIETQALKTGSPSALVEGAMRGMVDSLSDPYSVYLSRSEREDLDVRLQGTFTGVGIVVGAEKKSGQIVVVAPIKDTPAAREGIKSGDIITYINGETTKNMTVEDAVKLIRGEIGTQVQITVYREADKEEYTFKIVREEIKVSSVDAEMLSRTPPIGYIQITQFSAKTSSEFREGLQKVLEEGARGIIIDLRDNPGGEFDSAVEIADSILDKGDIVKIKGRSGRPLTYQAQPGGLENLPIIILVNKGSASAAEILAGALRDNKAAILVGEMTYGKGLVQTVFPLPGGAALKLTTNKYFTPKGTDINQVGIVPDYSLENPEDGVPDKQLARARQLMIEKLR